MLTFLRVCCGALNWPLLSLLIYIKSPSSLVQPVTFPHGRWNCCAVRTVRKKLLMRNKLFKNWKSLEKSCMLALIPLTLQ